MKPVFFLLLFSTLASAQTPPSQKPRFEIPPHLFSIKGEAIGVGWNYEVKTLAANSLTFQLIQSKKIILQIPVNRDEDYYFVKLPISSCGFGNSYEYFVNGMDHSLPIQNIPCDAKGTLRFSFISDTQEGPDIAHQFAQRIANFHGNFVLHGGDQVQTGDSYSNWVDFFKSIFPFAQSEVLVSAVGNHEYRGNVGLWQTYFRYPASEAHYELNLGHTQILVLNSCFADDPQAHMGQVGWLEEMLKKNRPFKIVMFHHPPFSFGLAQSPLAYRLEHLDLRRMYVPLFEKYKVNLVLNGHTHLFERSTKSGVEYLTAGAAGGKMGWFGGSINPYTWLSRAVRTVTNFEITPQGIRGISETLDGQVLDDLLVLRHQ